MIPRALGAATEQKVTANPHDFVNDDGTLDFPSLLRSFTSFWKQHGEVLTARDAYHEAAPHLVVMACLYKLVNGGGYVDRECAVGHGWIDLLVRWPYEIASNRTWQYEPLELKVWHPGRPDPLDQGLEQLDGYLQRLDVDHGALLIFDRRPDAEPLPERTTISDAHTPSGRHVTLIRA